MTVTSVFHMNLVWISIKTHFLHLVVLFKFPGWAVDCSDFSSSDLEFLHLSFDFFAQVQVFLPRRSQPRSRFSATADKAPFPRSRPSPAAHFPGATLCIGFLRSKQSVPHRFSVRFVLCACPPFRCPTELFPLQLFDLPPVLHFLWFLLLFSCSGASLYLKASPFWLFFTWAGRPVFGPIPSPDFATRLILSVSGGVRSLRQGAKHVTCAIFLRPGASLGPT
jgi:hypothetical protein